MMESQPRELAPSKEDAIDYTWLLVNALAAIVWPILRTGAGIEMPGLAGVIACVGIPVWAIQSHSRWVWHYWQLWIAFIGVYALSREKWEATRYQGRSRLFGAKRWALTLEAVLVLGVGAWFQQYPLGLMFLASGTGLCINEILARLVIRKQKLAMHNALVEIEIQRQRFNQGL
jgi:hypothetical protein